jgi:outer membrane receptor protein involved in Fe transport
MRNKVLQHLFLTAIILSCCTLPQLHAQTSYGSVVGNVTDSTGASIVGATVTLTNISTGTKRTSQTGNDGTYSFAYINPGHYRLDIAHEGFQKFTRETIEVQVGGASRVNASLGVGQQMEAISVKGEAPLLDTDTSSLGTVIEGRAVQDAPLNGRNVNNLLALVPGVVAGGSTYGNAVSNQGGGVGTNFFGFANYQIGGGFSGQSSFYLDGVLSNVLGNNGDALIPTQDAVGEFRVTTSVPSTEFGGTGGGIVSFVTKSGANSFHGNAYEYFRNTIFNANNYFNNLNSIPRAGYHQNQYGLNIGGPIQKDKTFFFFSWEKEAVRTGTPYIATVPTAAMRNGDFSASGIPAIYDTLTSGSPQFQCNSVLNVICPNRLDPSSVKIVNKLFPLPNRSGITNNYIVTAPARGDQDQFNARVDHNLSTKDSMFARYTYWFAGSPGSDPLGSKVGFPIEGITDHEAVIGNTYTVNPKTVVDLRLAYLYAYFNTEPLSLGTDTSAFGPAYAALTPIMGEALNPAPQISPGYGGGYYGAQLAQLYWSFNNYAITASVTKILGRHSVKMGTELRKSQWFAGRASQGIYSFFDSGFTSNGSIPSSGYGLASYMLGVPTSTSEQQNRGAHSNIYSYAAYVEDTYQATKNLTLNLGLRWDEPGSYREKSGFDTVLLPNAPDPLGSIVNPVTGATQQLHGQLALVNSPEYSSGNEQSLHWRLFAPRVGFAYRALHDFVVRGAYGIEYLPPSLAQQGPSVSTFNTSGTSLINTPGSIITTVSNPFLNGIILPPPRNQAALLPFEGQTIASPIPSQPYGYVQQWNFGIEHSVLRHGTFTLAYAGSKGTHLYLQGGGTFSFYNINQLPDQYDSLGSALLNTVANPLSGKLPASAGALASSTIAEGFLLKPYPQFQQVEVVAPTKGFSTYNALQSSFQYRLPGEGELLISYTWSKILSNTDSIINFLDPAPTGAVQDFNNLNGEKALSSYDVPQNLVISYSVPLPFGKGRQYFGDAHGVAGVLASGWRVNGITTFQAGTPLAFFSTAPNALSQLFGAGTIRPNVVSGCDLSVPGSAEHRLNQWFNTSCFTLPGQFSFGNERRTDGRVRTQGINNWDFALSKITPLTERVNLQFNAEFFNLFNRVQFGPPSTAVGSPIFGVVTSQVNPPRTMQFALRLSF